MLIEQTHFPQSGPDWSNVVIISLSLLVTGIIVYKMTENIRSKIKLKTLPEKEV